MKLDKYGLELYLSGSSSCSEASRSVQFGKTKEDDGKEA